jgi:anti-sigma factor RsiW
MNCEELLEVLNEYVDGTIDPAFCKSFEEHMASCNPCQVVVDNIRQTITLYRAGQPHALPETFRRHLHEVLRERWKAKYADGGDR